MALSKEEILAAKDLPTKPVKVPEWGGEVIVRTLTAGQRDEFEYACIKARGPDAAANIQNVRARLCAACIVDEQGNVLFGDSEIDALAHKSGAALDRVFAVAQKLNRLGAGDVEELAKNS